MSGIMMTSPDLVFFDKTKGSLKNRAQCAGEHLKNGLKSSAVVLGSAIASEIISDSISSASKTNIGKEVVNDLLEDLMKDSFNEAKGLEKISIGIKIGIYKATQACTNFFSKPTCQKIIVQADDLINKMTKGGLEKLSEGFKTKGTKTAFAVAVIGTIGTSIAVLLNNFYKKGQIDQKYTDKAQQEQNQIQFRRPKFPNSYGLGL